MDLYNQYPMNKEIVQLPTMKKLSFLEDSTKLQLKKIPILVYIAVRIKLMHERLYGKSRHFSFRKKC